MKIIADLHIHSKYSRATSKNISIANLVEYAKMKGLGLLGTGDFTHPLWLKELKETLNEDGSGIPKYGNGFPFVLSSEISSIYSQGGEVKRVHNVVLAPGFEVAEQINDALSGKGVKLASDGRPICGISCPELVDLIKCVSSEAEIIPAHIWTPWFSLFGSKSGFDRIEDCYGDQTKHIHALETGLSSDPRMNWRLSQLDKYSLVSFSDSHSFWPWRIGREATIFDLKNADYNGIIKALRTKDGLEGTIEVNPSYGKYHFDGHRDCKVSMVPAEAKRHNNICPVCRRPLTLGVLHRVEDLADREEGFVPEGAKKFHSLLPLSEMIAYVMGVQTFSGRVWEEYKKLTNAFGSEFNVLLDASPEELNNITTEKIANLVMETRGGNVNIEAGFDGVYGKISDDGKLLKAKPAGPQKTLGDF
ncbi:MAG: DNA helicase UvrD [Candidatus Aenigmarchaeota archaeon]|nr:DNA helicase UvrD [Candidatus Aenigmarchaeota archaeon]